MVELADALGSGSSVRKDVGVQIPPSALMRNPVGTAKTGFFVLRCLFFCFDRFIVSGIEYVVNAEGAGQGVCINNH